MGKSDRNPDYRTASGRIFGHDNGADVLIDGAFNVKY